MGTAARLTGFWTHPCGGGTLNPHLILSNPDWRMVVLVACLAASTALAGGSIYKYVEKDGTIVYTNVPPSGP